MGLIAGYVEKYSGLFKSVPQLGVTNYSTHTLYMTWRMMNVRCYDSRHKSYHRYGGRGIIVDCKWRWDNSFGFLNFLSDMGERPQGLTLDRKDNDGNYNPINCTWSTRREQANNISIGVNNTSGCLGVYWDNFCNSWVVQITLLDKVMNIGHFNLEHKDKAFERYYLIKQAKSLKGDEAALSLYLSLKDKTPTGKQKRRNKTSKYYGVSKITGKERWRAFNQEYVDGKLKQIALGCYDSEENAYKAVLTRRRLIGLTCEENI